MSRRYGKSTAIPVDFGHFEENKRAKCSFADIFFSTRTILMFLNALQRRGRGLSITSKIFEIGSLSSENDAFKVGSVRTARAILDVY